jgi:hypothetical protein
MRNDPAPSQTRRGRKQGVRAGHNFVMTVRANDVERQIVVVMQGAVSSIESGQRTTTRGCQAIQWRRGGGWPPIAAKRPTKDPMRRAARDALIALMSATARLGSKRQRLPSEPVLSTPRQRRACLLVREPSYTQEHFA